MSNSHTDWNEAVKAFERDGFATVPQALDPELTRAIEEAGDRLVAGGRNKDTPRASDHRSSLQRNCVVYDDAFIKLLRPPKTFGLVARLLSPNIQLHTSQLIYKHPLTDEPQNYRRPGWHRDIYPSPMDLGLGINRRFEVKVGYCLSDFSIDGHCGITLLARGSHRRQDPLSVNKESGDPPEVVSLKLKAGDAYLFENRTFHAGDANFTSRTAKVVIFGYSFCWMKPDDYLQQPDEFIAKLDDIDKSLFGAMRAPHGEWVPGGYRKPLTDWLASEGVSSKNHELLTFQ